MREKTMTLNQAFEHLLTNWENQPSDFKTKYRSVRSKYISGKDYVGEKIKRKILLQAGYKENWTN